MKKSLFKSLVGSILALLLLAGGGAKEWVHACASHTDTVHCHRNDGQLAFDPQHHHCDFLSYCFSPFTLVEAPAVAFHFQAPAFLTHAVSLTASPVSAAVRGHSDRGPPAIAAVSGS